MEIQQNLSYFTSFNLFIYYFLCWWIFKGWNIKTFKRRWRTNNDIFFLFFLMSNKKKNTTLLFAPSHFFFLMKIRQSSGSLPPHYYTINCRCKPSLIAHMTCCKSSQNTPFLSLYYLLQNQAKATHIVIQVSAVELAKTHLFKSFFMLQI